VLLALFGQNHDTALCPQPYRIDRSGSWAAAPTRMS